jgi:hypothetical protein
MATIFSSSDTAPLNAVIICCTTVITLNILSRGWMFTSGAWTDWPVAAVQGPVYFSSLLRVGKSTVVAAAAGLRCLGVPPRRRRLGWCGQKWTPFLLWFWVPSGTSSSGVPHSRACIPDSWRDAVFLLPPTGICSMLGWKMCFPSRGTCCAGVRPRTTNGEVAVWNLPIRGQTVGSCGTA